MGACCRSVPPRGGALCGFFFGAVVWSGLGRRGGRRRRPRRSHPSTGGRRAGSTGRSRRSQWPGERSAGPLRGPRSNADAIARPANETARLTPADARADDRLSAPRSSPRPARRDHCSVSVDPLSSRRTLPSPRFSRICAGTWSRPTPTRRMWRKTCFSRRVFPAQRSRIPVRMRSPMRFTPEPVGTRAILRPIPAAPAGTCRSTSC